MSTHPEAVRSRLRRTSQPVQSVQDRREANTLSLQRARNAVRNGPHVFNVDQLTQWWKEFSRLQPEPCSVSWRTRRCDWCQAQLLSTEAVGWCCHEGSKRLQPLPPLPTSLATFVQRFPADAAQCSRSLNYLFNLSAQGVSGGFVRHEAPYSLCITGRTYHRVFPVRRGGHPVNWFLHDPAGATQAILQTGISPVLVESVHADLYASNPLFQRFQDFSLFQPEIEDAAMQLLDPGSADEIAAVFHIGSGAIHEPRSLFVHRRSISSPTAVSILSPLYETLQYPILFPQGIGGWGEVHRSAASGHWTQIQWYKARLLTEPRFQQFSRLGSEWIVDMYSRVEDQRLHAIRMGKQTEITYFHSAPDGDSDDIELSYQLPSSFTGSARYYAEKVADALALARHIGKPDLMITATCNPNWPELASQIGPGQSATTVPQITVRVFKARFNELIRKLSDIFGGLEYYVSAIEFQKRGLPHAHIVVKLAHRIEFQHIDYIVSAELPRHNGQLRALVQSHMTHRSDHLEPGKINRCNRSGSCIYGFPHAILENTQLDEKQRVAYRRRSAEDAWIVPYCPQLLLHWQGHINTEVVFTTDVFLYLFKYLFKGVDYAKFQIVSEDNSDAADQYVQGRYLSAPEAAWRIMGFDICRQHPSVSSLKIHEPQQNRPKYSFAGHASTSEASDLIRYFNRPLGRMFDNLKFVEYYEQFSLHTIPVNKPFPALYWPEATTISNVPPRIITPRRQKVIARIQSVRPGMGEVFYIRALLSAFSARSFESLRTVESTLYPTFQEAAQAAGLFANDSEGLIAMQDAVANYKSPAQLRFLFALLILEGSPAIPLWDRFSDDLSRDYGGNVNGPMSHSSKLQALGNIQSHLQERGKNTTDFGLPCTSKHSAEIITQLQHFEPQRAQLQEMADSIAASFTAEQRQAFDILFNAIYNPQLTEHKLFFLTGRAGRGKTYVSEALVNYARAQGQLPFIVGATALSASNYDCAMTAHSGYLIPVVKDQQADIISGLRPHTKRADLIRIAPFLIIDEIVLLNIAVVEAIDNACQLITGCEQPFGGKPVITIGDFRQVAPVVKFASEGDTFRASILSWHLWPSFKVLELTQPMRNAADPQFSSFLDQVGEDFTNPRVNLDGFLTRTDNIQTVREMLFPASVLSDPLSCMRRAFLTPLNVLVNEFNAAILEELPGKMTVHYSYDSVVDDDGTVNDSHVAASPDYLAMIESHEAPNHELKLKKGAVCALMRNLSVPKGLVKNQRVVIVNTTSRWIEVRILQRNRRPDTTHLIPRINFDFQPPYSKYTIRRKQFPLRLAYSTTFNSCQGLTLDCAVLDCREDVFAHGQLYTALTRVKHRSHMMAYMPENKEDVRNVVFKKLLGPL